MKGLRKRLLGDRLVWLPVLCAVSLSTVAMAAQGSTQIPVEETPTVEVEAVEYPVLDMPTREDIEHYAYMDLERAPAELKPTIEAARKRIIFDGTVTAWTADNILGTIGDENGNVLEVVPHFHDVFPADWEMP